MTDSGFSSAASQRSTSSIIRQSHINSFSGSFKPDSLSIPSENEEHNDSNIPKPCMQFQTNYGRPVIPNRLIYGKNHGGYSPGLSPFSSHEMSPMSSLAYDFKDLNTSQNTSSTPRKRLSLSSISSLDSPHPSGSSIFACGNLSNASPAPSSLASSVNSPIQLATTDDGCFPETPTPTASEEFAFDGKHVRSLSHESTTGDKAPIFRRFKSMPASKQQARFRLLGVKESPVNSDKENEAPSARQIATRQRVNMVGSPMGLIESFSPIGIGKTFTRPRHGLQTMMSSPLVGAFSHGKSSAFKPVSPNEAAVNVKRRVLGAIDVNVPVVSVSPKQPTKIGGVKRFFDESASSSAVTVARKRKCSKSLNAKSAFLQERKTKSADAIVTGRPLPSFAFTSPVTSRSFMCRPISAPLLMGNDDDDYVLSHSSLCSHDSDDDDFRKNLSGDDFASVTCKEDDIENMMCENIRQEKRQMFIDSDQSMQDDAPTCLAGLISGPLLLNNSESSFAASDCNDSIAALGNHKGKICDNNEVKPRELFRSPSAPPLVPSRRALMKLKRAGRNPGQSSCETTPVSIKRPRTFASLSDAVETEREVPDPCLNRSKSYNELDVMKAVDQGCEDPSRVGDFSRACTLPTVAGRKQDLKYIAPHTLTEVLENRHNVGMVEVVDCRYTYEYDGGHIDGAFNVYNEEQLLERYFNCAKPMWATAKQQQAQDPNAKPHILVFHCEFSSERAPKMARALRNHDRDQNAYPKLHYPEIYILKDGYKEYFKSEKEHCRPCSYVPMLHEDYASDLRKFRIKSKTWAGEKSKHGLFNRLKHK